jgi:hypothetical protein
MSVEILLDTERTHPGQLAKFIARNARSFICEWLGEQISQGKVLKSFRSPANHLVEDDLMVAAYWFVVCYIDQSDLTLDSQRVSSTPICAWK